MALEALQIIADSAGRHDASGIDGTQAGYEMAGDDVGYVLEMGTRWADCDAYGHVNNVQYYSYFDTALTTMLIERGVLRSDRWHSIGLCVESQCRFHREIAFPDTVRVRVRIGRLGGKSIRFELAIFAGGHAEPAATGHFVHVYVDPVTKRPVDLTEGQKAAVADLVVAG